MMIADREMDKLAMALSAFRAVVKGAKARKLVDPVARLRAFAKEVEQIDKALSEAIKAAMPKEQFLDGERFKVVLTVSTRYNLDRAKLEAKLGDLSRYETQSPVASLRFGAKA